MTKKNLFRIAALLAIVFFLLINGSVVGAYYGGANLYDYGFIGGSDSNQMVLYEDRMFTREQLATLILQMKGESADALEADFIPTYYDSYNISDWAKPYVAYCFEQEYMCGKNNNIFDPKAYVTGKELGVVVLGSLGYEVVWEDVEANLNYLEIPCPQGELTRGMAFDYLWDAMTAPVCTDSVALVVKLGGMTEDEYFEQFQRDTYNVSTSKYKELTNYEYYGSELAERMIDTIHFGSSTVQEAAKNLMFGEKAFYIVGPRDEHELSVVIDEAIFQNPLTMEATHLYYYFTYEGMQDGQNVWLIEPEYLVEDPSARRWMQENMLNEAEAILKELDIDKDSEVGSIDDFYKINNYLVDYVEYDDYTDDGTFSDNVKGTAYDALVHGKGVCSAYAGAFQFLCSLCHYDVVVDVGYADGEYHAWNMVNVGDEWYFMDVTWNDSEELPNCYCMIPRAMCKDHVSDYSVFSYDGEYASMVVAEEDASLDYFNELKLSVEVDEVSDVLCDYFTMGYVPYAIRVLDNPTEYELLSELQEWAEYIEETTGDIYELDTVECDENGVFIPPLLSELEIAYE